MFAQIPAQALIAMMQQPFPSPTPGPAIVLSLPGLLLFAAVIVVVGYLVYRRFRRRSLEKQDASEASWLHNE